MTCYELDSSFQSIRKLKNFDWETNMLKRFSRDIDLLESDAELNNMEKVSSWNWSLQARNPVRSMDHMLNLLSEKAKSVESKISLQMQKTVTMLTQ